MLRDANDIEPGLIQYFDHAAIAYHPDVVVSYRPNTPVPPKVRGFVCVAVDGGHAVWMTLTTTYRPWRLHIRPEWRWNGSAAWRKTNGMFLADGANLYLARADVWVAMSGHDLSDPAAPGFLLPEGLEAVNAEIARQKDRRSPFAALTAPDGYVGPTGLTPGGRVDDPTRTSASTRT